MKCSIFNNSFDNKSTNYVLVSDVLSDIKNGKWKDQIDDIRACKTKVGKSELKKHLPAVTFSGTFELKPAYVKKTGKYDLVSKRDDHLLDYTGLVVIDIDNIPMKEVNRIKKLCDSDIFLHACFLSPSEGIKMLYEVDAPDEYHRNASFEQVKEYVEAFYSCEVDKSGKNISRLCYVSYDKDIFINPDYVCVSIDIEEYEAKQKQYEPTEPIDLENVSYDINFIWDVAKKWLDNKGVGYVVGERNNYIHKMACILNRAGVSHDHIVHLIQGNHSINKNMMGELITTVKGVCNRNSNEFGTKPIYDKRKKSLNIFDQ